MIIFTAAKRLGNITIMRSVANKVSPGRNYANFNYFMKSGSEKVEYFGVFSHKHNGCFPVENGKIVKDEQAKTPHAFLKDRHPAMTAEENRRQYSATGIIKMKNKTLMEWKLQGDVNYLYAEISPNRLFACI